MHLIGNPSYVVCEGGPAISAVVIWISVATMTIIAPALVVLLHIADLFFCAGSE
jgi:hypothetical protein